MRPACIGAINTSFISCPYLPCMRGMQARPPADNLYADINLGTNGMAFGYNHDAMRKPDSALGMQEQQKGETVSIRVDCVTQTDLWGSIPLGKQKDSGWVTSCGGRCRCSQGPGPLVDG